MYEGLVGTSTGEERPEHKGLGSYNLHFFFSPPDRFLEHVHWTSGLPQSHSHLLSDC